MATLRKMMTKTEKVERTGPEDRREKVRRLKAFACRRFAFFTPKKLPPMLNYEANKARDDKDYSRAAKFLEKLGRKLETLFPDVLNEEEMKQLSKIYRDAARFYLESDKPKGAARVTERLAGIYEEDCDYKNAAMLYVATAYSYMHLKKYEKAAKLYMKAASLCNGEEAEKFKNTAKNLLETAQQSI